jgi:hypothetical protein
MNENQGRRPEQANFSEGVTLRAVAFLIALGLLMSVLS